MTTSHDAAEYGRHIAEEYDAIYDGVFDTQGTVALLTELAAGGPVLEFGVGTGRLAIALAERGVDVHGIDGSAEMLELMAAKPGGEGIPATVGDFCKVEVDGQFAVVVLATNTIYALPDQETQLQCFANAARHLRHGGRLVVEAWIPRVSPVSTPTLEPRRLGPGYAGLVLATNDPIRQVLTTTQVVLGGSTNVRVYPIVHRYAYPAELDLMARMNGLQLESRWADWHRTPLTADSSDHVSVYRLAE